MNNSMLNQVVIQLGHAKGRWPEIATKSGVPYRTVQKIGSGKTAAPRIDTVEKLLRYFREGEAASV